MHGSRSTYGASAGPESSSTGRAADALTCGRLQLLPAPEPEDEGSADAFEETTDSVELDQAAAEAAAIEAVELGVLRLGEVEQAIDDAGPDRLPFVAEDQVTVLEWRIGICGTGSFDD